MNLFLIVVIFILICIYFFSLIKNSKKKKCEKCGSKHIDYGYWNRGWNHLCGQAFGERGHRCYDCGDLIWDQSDEELKETLPEWCEIGKSRKK